ncbi:MAG TPA: shikimate dehydrogenase, partial [Ramlibacter sp.]|nr:shikimate dehydrogenase [Ramlibacter sp.]
MKLEQIDGETRLYGIVGDPISAVRSPEVFNAFFARSGINAVLVPLHVSADQLASAWAGLTSVRNLCGLVFTMPHKARVTALLDEVGTAGRIVGAVNAARREPDGRWRGDMFDGAGFIDGLRAQGHAVKGWNVRLSGLGGAGAAIAVALAQAGVARLTLNDQDGARQSMLVNQLQAEFPCVRIATGNSCDSPF